MAASGPLLQRLCCTHNNMAMLACGGLRFMWGVIPSCPSPLSTQSRVSQSTLELTQRPASPASSGILSSGVESQAGCPKRPASGDLHLKCFNHHAVPPGRTGWAGHHGSYCFARFHTLSSAKQNVGSEGERKVAASHIECPEFRLTIFSSGTF